MNVKSINMPLRNGKQYLPYYLCQKCQRFYGVKQYNYNCSYCFKGKKGLEIFVNSKKYDLAFRLYPTNISQVLSIAEKKKYMPQKSTWFHPKPLDGLISSKIIS